jgi:hypothetical protein
VAVALSVERAEGTAVEVPWPVAPALLEATELGVARALALLVVLEDAEPVGKSVATLLFVGGRLN